MNFFNWIGKGKEVSPETISEDLMSNDIIIDESNRVDESLESSSASQVSDREEETYDITAALEEFRVYLAYRVPSAMVFGGIAGGYQFIMDFR